MTGIPGKTRAVDTLDRETGEFLWGNPTVDECDHPHRRRHRRRDREPRGDPLGPRPGGLACPSWAGGKDWESV